MLDSANLRVQLPKPFLSLWKPSRFKAYYGGRGSAKSHSIATALVLMGYERPLRILCCREVQKSIQDSVKTLLDDKIASLGLSAFYRSTNNRIEGANGTVFLFSGLRDQTADSIKSKEGVDIAWVEEAHTVTRRSLDILIPTVRNENSEVWFSWNPETEFDPVDQMFRGAHVPPDSIVMRVNYEDNPWFPDVLRKDLEFDYETDPEKAAHVWGGEYRSVADGAYYARQLATALKEGRITSVPHDPGLEVHAAFDIGVGANMAIWFSQWIGREIRIIDYLQGDDEAADEGLAWYVRKMREKRYNYAPIILPHDGRHKEAFTAGKSREEMLRGHNFDTQIVPKMKPDDRIEMVKRYIPMMYIDANKCQPGLRALREYRENYDDKLRISRGPLHDWTSHAADALGHLIQAYDEPQQKRKPQGRPARAGGWMG